MYTSDCVAYRKDVKFIISEVFDCHRLDIEFAGNCQGLTLSTEQLLQLSEAIEWYLFRKENPAATLEECLEELG